MKKMTVGEKIRARRKYLGMSQESLADKAGVSALTVVRVENGRYEPRIETLRNLSEALSVPINELLG